MNMRRNIFSSLYVFMSFLILFVTMIVDKKIDSPFQNTITIPNFVCYLIAFACIIFFMKYNPNFVEKYFVKIIGSIFLLSLIFQLGVSLWAPTELNEDFGVVRNMAIYLNDNGSFANNEYFYKYSNNVNITILFSWILKITSSWRAIVILGAMLTNLSLLITIFTIYNITKDKYSCVIFAVVGEILVATTWRSFIPYTDNFAMPFGIAMVYLYTTKLSNKYKLPIIFLLGLIGSWIKITVLIPLIAIVIVELFGAFFDKRYASIIKILFLCIMTVVVGACIDSQIKKFYLYQENKTTVGWQYYFMMGSDESGVGTVSGTEYRKLYDKFVAEYDTKNEVNEQCFNTGLKWLKNRKIVNNVKFYLKKLNIAYNDGLFDNVQPFDANLCERNLFYEILLKDGTKNQSYAILLQILWDFVLILVIFSGGGNSDTVVAKIIIMGITIYVCIFEDRAKYLYMFLPIYIVIASVTFSKMKCYIKNRNTGQ